jgi:hypothetical protein
VYRGRLGDWLPLRLAELDRAGQRALRARVTFRKAIPLAYTSEPILASIGAAVGAQWKRT